MSYYDFDEYKSIIFCKKNEGGRINIKFEGNDVRAKNFQYLSNQANEL